MGDYVPHAFDDLFGPAAACPRDATAAGLLHATDMPLPQVQASATALAGRLDSSKDEQILKETCLRLCQLFGDGIQNDRIQSILEADVVPRLVGLLKPSKGKGGSSEFRVPISVQSAALQVIGNIACGDDRQTQVIIDCQALPCLKALLSSNDRGIRKECCWIVSNITESAHQVQDVLEAGVLPPLLKLLDSQDAACREDATWVLYNITANREARQIEYLAEHDGIRALCNLLSCQKTLDVIWKGCNTVAAVALKGLRNILVVGQTLAKSSPPGYNRMAALVAEAHGVDKMEALSSHASEDVRGRARLLLERMFGAETPARSEVNSSGPVDHSGRSRGHALSCTCAQLHSDENSRYYNSGGRNSNGGLGTHGYSSSSASSSTSEPDEDDSDSDLIPPPPPPCQCVLCKDSSPLVDVKARNPSQNLKNGSSTTSRGTGRNTLDGRYKSLAPICDFCSGGGKLGDSRVGLASKLGRAVRLGHSHCLAGLLSRMTWSQRGSAVDSATPVTPGDFHVDSPAVPAFVLASQMGKYECLELLLRRTKPDLDSLHGRKRLTALAYAVHKGYYRCAELLLDCGANPSARSSDSVTALHVASHPTVVDLLLSRNAAVNVKSAKKQTPLSVASQAGNVAVVRLLLAAGADPNIECEGKSTALHLAATGGHLSCCQELVGAGARVDAKTSPLAITPLHYAVQGGYALIVRLLISHGAKVNCSRKPLLVVAADDGNVDVVGILLDALAQVDCKASVKATLGSDHEIFDELSPLMLAASKGHTDVVRLLVQRGADVNLVSPKGWTPIEFALWNGKGECARVLLEAGCTVSAEKRQVGCELKNCTMLATKIKDKRLRKDLVTLILKRIAERSDNRTADESSRKMHPNNPSGQDREVVGSSDSVNTSACKTTKNSGSRFHGEKAVPANVIPMAPPLPPPPRSSRSSAGCTLNPGRTHFHKEESLAQQRKKDAKRRETEAIEAREKLREAVAQKSIPKLVDAITNANKLLLQMATSPNPVLGASGVSPASLSIKLNADIDNARNILSTLQASERKLRSTREKHAAQNRLQGWRRTLNVTLRSILQGADPKSLHKALKNAKRGGLPTDDPVLVEAKALINNLSAAEAAVRHLALSVECRDEAKLEDAVDEAERALRNLGEEGSLAAAKVFRGDPKVKLGEARRVLKEIHDECAAQEVQSRREAEAEARALDVLAEARAERNLSSIESALKSASKVVRKEVRTVEEARKQFNRQLKNEKRKLRSARATNDIPKLDVAIERAKSLNLEALASEIKSTETRRQVLSDQAEAMSDLAYAKSSGDAKLLSEVRTRLESLGMVSESEEARRLLDNLARVQRARDNLVATMVESRAVVHTWKTKREWQWNLNKLLGRKISELLKKGKTVGGLDDLIVQAEQSAREYAQSAREALDMEAERGDVREIARGVEAYCKDFLSTEASDVSDDSIEKLVLPLFNAEESVKCIRNARERMEQVQHEEQEKVKLESELALARATNRSTKRTGGRRDAEKTTYAERSGLVQGGSSAGDSAERPQCANGIEDRGEKHEKQRETPNGKLDGVKMGRKPNGYYSRIPLCPPHLMTTTGKQASAEYARSGPVSSLLPSSVSLSSPVSAQAKNPLSNAIYGRLNTSSYSKAHVKQASMVQTASNGSDRSACYPTVSIQTSRRAIDSPRFTEDPRNTLIRRNHGTIAGVQGAASVNSDSPATYSSAPGEPLGRILGQDVSVEEEGSVSNDLGLDFANENFGFDIDTIVDDCSVAPSTIPVSSDGEKRFSSTSQVVAPVHSPQSPASISGMGNGYIGVIPSRYFPMNSNSNRRQ